MLSPKSGILLNSFPNPSSPIMLHRYIASLLACANEMGSASNVDYAVMFRRAVLKLSGPPASMVK